MPGPGPRASARADAGFTLAEAMVALVIVGAAVVPLLGAISRSVRAEADVGAAVEAVALAEARMGQLSVLPLDSIPAYLQPRTGVFPAPLTRYRWRALVRPRADAPAVLQAAVVVEWEGREYTLETYFHRPEMLPDAPVRR
jgi:prepilin-type N-terminal cleavage/methylation domain-containing protein